MFEPAQYIYEPYPCTVFIYSVSLYALKLIELMVYPTPVFVITIESLEPL